MRRFAPIALVLIVMSACGPATPSPTASPAPTTTWTPIPNPSGTAFMNRYATTMAHWTETAAAPTPLPTAQAETATPSIVPIPTKIIPVTDLPTNSRPPTADPAPIPPGASARLGIGPFYSTAISPDGHQLAVGTTVAVSVYDAATFKQLWNRGVKSPVMGIAWSPSGSTIATWYSGNNNIETWDSGTGRQIAHMEHSLPFHGVAWSADSTRLVTAWGTIEGGPSVSIWDSTSGQLLRTTEIERNVDKRSAYSASAVAWSPDGTTIAAAAEYPAARQSDVKGEAWGVILISAPDGIVQAVLTIPDLMGCAELQHLSYSPDGTQLVAYTGKTEGDAPCGDGRAILWHLPDPTPLYLTSSTERYNAVFTVAWSSDGKQIALGGDNKDSEGAVTTWDTATGKLLKSFNGQPSTVRTLLWSRDKQSLISGSGFFDEQGAIVAWDTATGDARFEVTGFPEHVTDLFWLPDGSSFGAASIDQLRTFDYHGQVLENGLDSPYGVYGVTSLVWSHDGKHISTGIADTSVTNRITTWDVAAKIPLYSLRSAGQLIAESPDGTMLVTDSGSNSQLPYQYWDMLTGQNIASPQWTFAPGEGWTGISTHSPDGKMSIDVEPSDAAQRFSTKVARIKDAQTGKVITQLGSVTDEIQCAAWSFDGKYVAAGGGMSLYLGSLFVEGWNENAIRIWEVGSWRVVRTFVGHTGSVNSLAWSPDSTQLASGSADGTVIIWNVAP